jgi:hypothetical protein
MGFPSAEVAAGVAELLAARGVEARAEVDGEHWTFRARDAVITVGPLPAARVTHALFQPRTLLVLTGDGDMADTLRSAIREKFLRVMG